MEGCKIFCGVVKYIVRCKINGKVVKYIVLRGGSVGICMKGVVWEEGWMKRV